MPDDLFAAVIFGLTLVPVFGTLLGWHRDDLWFRTLHEDANACPSCGHPEHWPWCRDCGCDLFTEPDGSGEGCRNPASQQWRGVLIG